MVYALLIFGLFLMIIGFLLAIKEWSASRDEFDVLSEQYHKMKNDFNALKLNNLENLKHVQSVIEENTLLYVEIDTLKMNPASKRKPKSVKKKA